MKINVVMDHASMAKAIASRRFNSEQHVIESGRELMLKMAKQRNLNDFAANFRKTGMDVVAY